MPATINGTHTTTTPRVAIIGAGMSGMCMAMRLHREGIETFTIYEKAGEVGGTWRENRYPGLSCDVPSPFYSYSFAPNTEWTTRFSGGDEIQAYFKGVAQRAGVLDRVRYDTEIVDAAFDGDRWRLRSAGGEEFTADVVVAATGVLHQPRIPDIPGLETFDGAAFHSARWDESVPLNGRRIAVDRHRVDRRADRHRPLHARGEGHAVPAQRPVDRAGPQLLLLARRGAGCCAASRG